MRADVSQVRQAARGDRAAFAGLYDAWSAPLFAYLVSLLRRRDEAEDALHDAFLAAWTRLRSLRDLERFVPWLFRIARNAALSGRRRARTEAVTAEPAMHSAQADDEVAVPLLDTLAPDVRAVLLLRYVVGWNVEETAEALDTSTATVKRLTASGLERLRTRLEGTTP